MSWISNDWTHRAPVVVDNSQGIAGSIDASIALPDDWTIFWDNVDVAGVDIRVCDPDGRTVLDYQLVSFDSTARTGSIEVNNYQAPAGKPLVLWLYWGNPGAASAAAAPFAAASPKDGFIEVGVGGPVLVSASPESAGATTPRNVMAKNTLEEFKVWFDFTSRLRQRAALSAGRPLYEEISYVEIEALDGSGTPTSSIYTIGDTRLVGQGKVGVFLKGGNDGEDYTLRVSVVTTLGLKFVGTLGVRVKDTDEA